MNISRTSGRCTIEKHHCLDVVDVVNPEPLQLQLDHLQELTVKTLDVRNDF